MTTQPSAFIPASDDREFGPPATCLFEVQHGNTVIRIADDWDGHLLIEKLYAALREARQAHDKAALLRKVGPTHEDKLVERAAT